MVKLTICCQDNIDYGIVKNILTGVGEDNSDFEVYESAEDVLDCLDHCGKKHNVFYFDARRSDINFLELAKAIRKRDRQAYLIFCDVMKPEAKLLHELPPCEFMYHPVNRKYLNELYRWYCEFRSVNKLDYVFRFKNILYRFSNDDILYMEKDRRKAILHDIRGNCFQMYKSTEELLQELNSDIFAQISRFEIVNLSHVEQVDIDSISMDNGKRLQLSRRKRNEVNMKFTNIYHLLRENDRLLHFVYEWPNL